MSFLFCRRQKDKNAEDVCEGAGGRSDQLSFPFFSFSGTFLAVKRVVEKL